MQIRLHIRSSYRPNLVMTGATNMSHRSRVKVACRMLSSTFAFAKIVLATGSRLTNNGNVLER
jgi:hypothetical protein